MAGAAFDTMSMTHSMLERQWSKTWRGADEEGKQLCGSGAGEVTCQVGQLEPAKRFGHVRHGPRTKT